LFSFATLCLCPSEEARETKREGERHVDMERRIKQGRVREANGERVTDTETKKDM